MQKQRKELIGEVRRILAIVGIAALRPDLVVLDEFQRSIVEAYTGCSTRKRSKGTSPASHDHDECALVCSAP